MAKQENYNMGQGREKLITNITNKTVAEIFEPVPIYLVRIY
jgi:hypothetical protein